MFKIMTFFIRVMVFFASLCLGIAMVLTTVDVVGRYFFNAPMSGTYEMTELLMGFFSPMAIVFCAWKKEHISVDIIYNVMPKVMQRVCVGLTVVIQAVISVALAAQSFYLIRELVDSGTVTPVLSLPYWPTGWAIAFSFAFFALLSLLEIFGARFVNTDEEVLS